MAFYNNWSKGSKWLLGIASGGIGNLLLKTVNNIVDAANDMSKQAKSADKDFMDKLSGDNSDVAQALVDTYNGSSENPYFAYRNGSSAPNFGSDGENGLTNWWNSQTGNGLTDAERMKMMYQTWERQQAENFNHNEAVDARNYEMYMAQNKYQMETQSMKNAGVNPAMVYGGGSLVPTSATGATGSISPQSAPSSPNTASITGIVDLLSTMVRMPRELRMLDAEIDATKAAADERRANAELTRQRRETEIFNTRIAQIDAKYKDAFSQQELNNLKQTYDNLAADTDLKKSNKDKIDSEAKAQDILNLYLDERQRAEIDQIKANKEKLNADEAYTKAQKIYQDWLNGFVQANGFLPSSNDYLMLGAYICSIFDIDKEDVKRVMEEIMDDFVPGHKRAKAAQGRGGSTSPTGGDAPVASGNSR